MTRLRAFLLWLSACWSPRVRLPEPYETLPGPQADAEMLRRDTAAVSGDIARAYVQALREGIGPCARCGGRTWQMGVCGGLHCAGCGALPPAAGRKEAPQ